MKIIYWVIGFIFRWRERKNREKLSLEEVCEFLAKETQREWRLLTTDEIRRTAISCRFALCPKEDTDSLAVLVIAEKPTSRYRWVVYVRHCDTVYFPARHDTLFELFYNSVDKATDDLLSGMISVGQFVWRIDCGWWQKSA